MMYHFAWQYHDIFGDGNISVSVTWRIKHDDHDDVGAGSQSPGATSDLPTAGLVRRARLVVVEWLDCKLMTLKLISLW